MKAPTNAVILVKMGNVFPANGNKIDVIYPIMQLKPTSSWPKAKFIAEILANLFVYKCIFKIAAMSV